MSSPRRYGRHFLRDVSTVVQILIIFNLSVTPFSSTTFAAAGTKCQARASSLLSPHPPHTRAEVIIGDKSFIDIPCVPSYRAGQLPGPGAATGSAAND